MADHGHIRQALDTLRHQADEVLMTPVEEGILEVLLNKVDKRLLLRSQVREHTGHLEKLVERKTARVVELERKLAAKQIVEGLATAQTGFSGEVERGGVFNELPCFISVHSSDCTVVTANVLYFERFGDRIGHKSNGIYHDFKGPGCCPARQTVNSESGGKNTATLRASDGSLPPRGGPHGTHHGQRRLGIADAGGGR